MPHKPLTDRDRALIAVLCSDGESRCDERMRAAITAGDSVRKKRAMTDLLRYRSLRLKMFSPA